MMGLDVSHGFYTVFNPSLNRYLTVNLQKTGEVELKPVKNNDSPPGKSAFGRIEGPKAKEKKKPEDKNKRVKKTNLKSERKDDKEKNEEAKKKEDKPAEKAPDAGQDSAF